MWQNSQQEYEISSSNKRILSGFREQILAALSYFPELKGIELIFEEKKARFPLKSFPDPFTIFNRPEKRRYRIVISNNAGTAFERILLKNLPEKAQIGVIGHELAHTSDYLKMNLFRIIYTGLAYLFSPAFRRKFERCTDEITIAHGLGEALLAWRLYFEALSKKETKTNLYFEDRYLSAEEIKNRLDTGKL